MGKNILVVDNNPLMLKLMETFLSRFDHTVTCVPDGFSCLDLLSTQKPDIIFLDLVMPQLGGDDLCRIIRSMESLKDCYVVIVSAAVVEGEFDVKAIGADGCIAKGPFKEMEKHILEAIEDSCRGTGQSEWEIRGKKSVHSRQITKELLQQNKHLKAILETMSQGVMELDNDRIAYLNPKAAEILGVPREQLLGMTIHRSLPRSLLDKIESLADLSPTFDTEPVKIADRQVQVELVETASDGGSQLVILSDVTERRKLEAVIEATNLTENIGYIFSGIRHEIGNPVNSIKMALSVLKRNLMEYDRATILEFTERSLEEVTRIEYLLKSLKNYSLFERPVLQVESVNRFMENFFSLVEKDFASRKIKLRNLLPESDVKMLTDLRALHHIMLNLMTNAADAVETIKEPQLIVEVRDVLDRVEIRVSDNGVGIPREEQDHLFKPFYTSKPGGTGLGLVIVRKMLTAIDGRIQVESYRGIGTTVTVSLPAGGNEDD